MRADIEISDGKKSIYDKWYMKYSMKFENPFSRLFGWKNVHKRLLQFQNAAMVWSTADETAVTLSRQNPYFK